MPPLVKIVESRLPPGNLFSENNRLLFQILPPQRRFKWKEQQVGQLWEDIENARSNGGGTYFLGTLLLAPIGDVPITDGKVSVIDGQQRITTLSILLAVLRDECYKFEDLRTRADNLQKLISRVDYDGKSTGELVVTLQEPDNTIYRDIVKDRGSTGRYSANNTLLHKATRELAKRVTNRIYSPKEEDDQKEPEERLRTLCEYIQTRVMLLPLEVPNEAEGYLVFDTTNTRGLRLSPSESLKGRLATIAREDSQLSEELIKIWNSASQKLESAGLPINAMDDYLHSILCAREGHTNKKALDKISYRFNTDVLRDFVDDLYSYCDSYLAVVAPTGKAWITEDLKDLHHLNVQSHRFLTMVHKHFNSRFEEAVSLVLALQIRNITLGPFQANQYEKDWSSWAKQVREGQVEKAFDEIRSLMVDDAGFRDAFEKAEVPSAPIARHLLRRLDPITQPKSGILPVDVDVEHIMPKSVVNKLTDGKKLTRNVRKWITDLECKIPEGDDGSQELGKQLKPHLNKLGNQALLNENKNKIGKDKPFAEKKALYREQGLKLTIALTEFEEWGPTQIEQRQKQMAERAVHVWKR